jgi:voltage-gated potassium channel
LIWSVFVAELAFVLIVAPRKKAALRAHWLDVAIVLFTAPPLGRFLASLRLVRLVRLFRLLRLGVILGRAVQAERALGSGDALRIVGLITVFVVVVSGAVESVIDTGDFQSLWDAIWWAVVTVTTVGYGDVYPTTVPGRVVAMALMLVGIGFLSVLTATIASHFVKADTGAETNEILATLTTDRNRAGGVEAAASVKGRQFFELSLPASAISTEVKTWPSLTAGRVVGSVLGVRLAARPALPYRHMRAVSEREVRGATRPL